MNISVNIHAKPDDHIRVHRSTSDPSVMWIDIGSAAIFGDDETIERLRDACNARLAMGLVDLAEKMGAGE